MLTTTGVKIERLEASAYTVPTESPESDGTLEWDSTTVVVVRLFGGGKEGAGYSYTSAGALNVIRHLLAPRIEGMDVMDTGMCWLAMKQAIRNIGQTGVAMAAVAAVDAALWDLKARILELPLVSLLGACRKKIPAYGSGGFTSYSLKELAEQLGGWSEEGFRMVKMKIGRNPAEDPVRIHTAREAIGPDVELFVDANGAFGGKQALAFTDTLMENGVVWYEQPVYHLDFEGMRMLRDRLPASIEITSGEYTYESNYFRRMIESGTVDVAQADATRCGITGFLQAGVLCEANFLPLSAHTAPALHLHLACAAASARNIEYFFDHYRIEQMLFDGAQKPENGLLAPDLDRAGLGLELKERDAEKYLLNR